MLPNPTFQIFFFFAGGEGWVMPCGMWDLSSSMKDHTHDPCNENVES